MKALQLYSIIFLFFSLHVQARSNTSCNIRDAPVLRGFFIGQTVQEIDSMIPGFQSIYDKEVENENMPKFRTPRAEAGFILIYPRLGEQRVPNENLKDVEFIWHLLDGKIFFISASYTKFDPPNLKFFVRQVAEKTNLPIQGWSFRDGNYAILRCVGFQIDVWTGKYAKNPGYEDYPSVTITDINASAELEKRVSEITRRKKEDELAKLRHEKEKKTIFKP